MRATRSACCSRDRRRRRSTHGAATASRCRCTRSAGGRRPTRHGPSSSRPACRRRSRATSCSGTATRSGGSTRPRARRRCCGSSPRAGPTHCSPRAFSGWAGGRWPPATRRRPWRPSARTPGARRPSGRRPASPRRCSSPATGPARARAWRRSAPAARRWRFRCCSASPAPPSTPASPSTPSPCTRSCSAASSIPARARGCSWSRARPPAPRAIVTTRARSSSWRRRSAAGRRRRGRRR